MDGITHIAQRIGADLKQRLPKQRKTQREKLALLVATMLDVRRANLMDLAAGLPTDGDRTDMRYQWITRFLGNPLVLSDEVSAGPQRQRRSDGAVGARGPGAGGRRRQADRSDCGPIQNFGSPPGPDAGSAVRGAG